MPERAFLSLNYLFLTGDNVMEIDFTKKHLLTEGWLKTFGNWNKTLLKYIYGDDVQMTADVNAVGWMDKYLQEDNDSENEIKFVIRGEYKDVKAYASALVAEKNYIDALVQYDDNHPHSVKTKIVLDQAVQEFQNTTGIKWPFAD
jgi:hypothetical protein|tara:strand:+ start:1176 stop:1610 length:435 start_codon:yes stop_codon:yes gene_type:complete